MQLFTKFYLKNEDLCHVKVHFGECSNFSANEGGFTLFKNEA